MAYQLLAFLCLLGPTDSLFVLLETNPIINHLFPSLCFILQGGPKPISIGVAPEPFSDVHTRQCNRKVLYKTMNVGLKGGSVDKKSACFARMRT